MISLHKLRLVVAAVILLAGCETVQQQGVSKETGGAVLGAIAGGLLGSTVGEGSGQVAGTIVGSLLGAWIGTEIGASLDRADRAAIEQESAQALASSKDGQTVAWRNPDTGASANITTENTRSEKREVTLVREKRVAYTPSLELIGENYAAIKNANVRAEPSTHAEIISGLKAGESFNAIGRVTGDHWIMVGKGNRSIGYIHDSLVKPASEVKKPELRAAVDLDSVALDDSAVADKVTVATSCRTVNYDVASGDGKSAKETFEACKGADGAWEIL